MFGSNESGIHGAGAASLANKKFGAIFNLGFGSAGQTFAIPTKDWNIQTLPINIIKFYIERFIECAVIDSEHTYLVTEIGCGLAGYKSNDIAPLFEKAKYIENIHLPESFWQILNNE